AEDVGGLLALLRAAGYLPVAERDGGSLRPGSSHGNDGVRRLLRPSQVAIGLSPAEAAALAAALRAGPGSPRAPGSAGSAGSAGSSIRGGRPPEPAAARLLGGP